MGQVLTRHHARGLKGERHWKETEDFTGKAADSGLARASWATRASLPRGFWVTGWPRGLLGCRAVSQRDRSLVWWQTRAMPSELRSAGRRTRSKSRAVRGVQARLVSCEAGCNVENPPTALHLRNVSSGREAIMAATPQSHWLASLRDFRVKTHQSLMKMWAYKRFGFFILFIFAMLFLGCYFSCGEC